MATAPTWRDSSNVVIASPLAVSGTGGTAGTAVVARLWNDYGASSADSILGGRLLILSRSTAAATLDPATPYTETGRPALDRQMIEVRITGGLGDMTLSASDWTPMGRCNTFSLPGEIAAGDGVALEIRVNAPADAGDVDEQVRIVLIDDKGRLIGEGVSFAGGDGVCCSLGNPDGYQIVSGGDVTEDDAGASSDVDVPDIEFISAGKLFCLRSHEVTITASTAGKDRYVGIILETDGTSGQVAGSEVATGTLAESDKPAIADDEILLAWVVRDDSATILTADITNVWKRSLFAVTYSSLTATVHSGPYAVVDDSLVYHVGTMNATLDASSTCYLWLLPSGALEVTTTDVPSTSAVALLLAILTTDGSGVTAFQDCRVISGAHSHVAHLSLAGDLDTTTYAYITLPNAKAAWLDPLRPIVAGIGAQGDHTAGSTLFDVQVRRSGTYTSLFADTADMPTIAYDAATTALYDADVIPDDYDLPAFAQIRVKCNTLPTGGANDPDDGQVTLMWRY